MVMISVLMRVRFFRYALVGRPVRVAIFLSPQVRGGKACLTHEA